jgi:DNA-binding response OmpR family regulator
VAIVDDDARLTEIVQEELEADGYQVSTFSSAETFLRYVNRQGLPHLVLIDLRLPDMDGFALSERLKALGDVPIIFISAQKEANTVVRGLVQYAEDYVRKPFDPRELAARVYRVLSRIPGFDYAESRIVRIDDWLAIDFGQRVLFVGERELSLTRTEANLLHVLLRNANQVVPARVLISRVWPLQDVYEETLRVHMHRLRQKIEPDPANPQYLLTERGLGYRFVRRGA